MLDYGEHATQILLCEVGDERFPHAIPLATLHERAGADTIDVVVPHDGRTIRASTAGWGADPERTAVVVTHSYRPPAGQEPLRPAGSPFPPAVNAVRLDWLAAREAGDADRAAELEVELDAAFAAHGWRKPFAGPKDGRELEPGVYLVDARR